MGLSLFNNSLKLKQSNTAISVNVIGSGGALVQGAIQVQGNVAIIGQGTSF